MLARLMLRSTRPMNMLTSATAPKADAYPGNWAVTPCQIDRGVKPWTYSTVWRYKWPRNAGCLGTQPHAHASGLMRSFTPSNPARCRSIPTSPPMSSTTSVGIPRTGAHWHETATVDPRCAEPLGLRPCSMRARVRHAESRPHRQGVARSTEGQIEGCERASFTEAFRSDALWTAIMVVLELPLRIGQRSEAAASERYACIDS